MSNAELADVLRSAASALAHGRHVTASKKLLKVLQEELRRTGLLDLLQQDIYTDAHEYRERVEKVKELVNQIAEV